MKKIADRLKLLRKEKNLRQADLGKILGFSRTTIANYEQEIRIPPTETLYKFAEYFGVSLDYLTGRSNERLCPERYPQKNQPILIFINPFTLEIIHANSKALTYFGSNRELLGQKLDKISSFSREELLDKINGIKKINFYDSLVINDRRKIVEISVEYIKKDLLSLVINLSHENIDDLLDSLIKNMGNLITYIDPYKKNHGNRVASIALKIGKKLNLPPTRLNIIKKAGIIHDIGLIAIPAQILTKPEKIKKAEFELIKEHPLIGHNIIKETNLHENIARSVLQHHERIDGSGYPEGLKKSAILIEAQILAVADVIDAMTSHRAYRTAHSLCKALQEISQKKGTKYNPEVVQVCLEIYKDSIG